MLPPLRDRVFEPFFTTRREDGGTGMGLGIVRSLLHGHGGSIAVAASQRGAAFEITLPSDRQWSNRIGSKRLPES